VWPKQRGRTKKRIDTTLVKRFIERELLPLRVTKSARSKTPREKQYALTQSLNWWVTEGPWPPIPNGPLIAVADAVVKYLGTQWQSWYFIVVRSVHSDEAVMLPPYHQQGTEVTSGWLHAFARVDAQVHERIVALVSDGHRGLRKVAHDAGWLQQRCHFHLLKRLQAQRSRWPTGRHREEAERIYRHTKAVLTTTRPITHDLAVLRELAETSTSREVRVVIRGFLSNYEDFRTYLRHPELHLPTTSNTAESLVGMVESMATRSRGFKGPVAFHKWIIALIKVKKKIKCRPG
jgi:hypothetical protein